MKTSSGDSPVFEHFANLTGRVAKVRLGVLLAWWGVRLFIAASPEGIPRLAQVTLDGTALFFTLSISVLTGLLFGVVPAWHASRGTLNPTLRDSGRNASAGAHAGRTRGLLVIAEVGVSLVLLVAAGLMLQTFARMLRIDRGFDPSHLLAAELDFSVSGFTTWIRPTATRPQVPQRELMERLRAVPGVQAVGLGSRLLRRNNQPPNETIAILGRSPSNPQERLTANFSGISPGWLQALGQRLQRGRDFTEADTLQAPGVVLINQSLAERYFGSEDPVGRFLKLGSAQPPAGATNAFGQTEWSQIVGVVSDVKSLHTQPQAVPEAYVPYWQWPMQTPTLLLRTTGDSASVATAIRRETKHLIPSLPPPRIRTVDDLVSATVAQPRLQTVLVGGFGILALLLTAVGLYGVVAVWVEHRRQEMGIRLALGAQPREVLLLVLRKGAALTLLGVGVGLLASLGLTRVMRSLLYGVTPTDPLTLLGVASLLLVVAALACWIPARRAARIHPMLALRAP